MATKGKVITCRAAVLWKPNTPYVIEHVDVDPPKADEVRIKMTSAGACHTDLHYQEGCDKSYPFPTVLGHEGAGIVESVGSDVKSVVPGDLVVISFERYCGKCNGCKNENTNRCHLQNRKQLQADGTSRIKCKGQELSQMYTVSTFSEYTVVCEGNVAKVNQKAPPNKIGIAGCCIPTGYGAAVKCAKVKPGSTCAIWGLGGVGMNVVLGCRDSKASKIIGIDVNSGKFKLAKELGCTDVLNPKDCTTKSVPEVLAEMTNGGVDYCFASVGVVSAMEQAFESCHPGWGETIIVGLADVGEKMKVDIWELLFGKKVKGTYYGSYKTKLALPELVDKVVSNQIPIDKLVTHRVPLDDITHAFNMLHTGESLRTVIDYSLKK